MVAALGRHAETWVTRRRRGQPRSNRGASSREPHHRYHGIVLAPPYRCPRADKSAAVRPGLAQFRDVTHTHVAGSIHADSTARAPSWLSMPSDVNTLLPSLWSTGVHKDATGVLTVAGLSVVEIAEQVGTPVYVVDEADLRARARAFAAAFEGWDVYYAAKSFLCTTVARWVTEEGLGVDVCTGGELAVVERAGIDLRRVGLHGNNKSVEELRQALTSGVGRIIVDSFDEIARLSAIAEELQIRPRVMVRATTGVEAHTHEYIATAHEDQKFGFSIADGTALSALLSVPPGHLA